MTFCTQKDNKLEKALMSAGSNREELEKVLHHFSKKNSDKLKYKATCYLIIGMADHYSNGVILNYDKRIDYLRRGADSIYYGLIKNKTASEINTKEFYHLLSIIDKKYRDSVGKILFSPPNISIKRVYDITRINADFLQKHIDNAFEMREKSPFVKRLSFEDFCEYILPYRAIKDYPFVMNGKELNQIYYKYIQTDKHYKVEDAIQSYNWTASRLRYFMGNYPFDSNVGLNELFFNGIQNCVDYAVYGANVLRACGIPAAVEYNIAYKLWRGRHYHISTLDSIGRWCTFSPETGLPKYRDSRFCEALNIYRIHFTPQKNNPTYLKQDKELIPYELSNPCIEDVTHNIMKTVQVKLPFNKKTNNHLAYLSSFQSHRGMTAVTWGKINHLLGKVTFEHVVPDNLYFPVYYTLSGKLEAFGAPFWLKADTTQSKGYTIEQLPQEKKFSKTVNLVRKFPRKPNLKSQADSLVGVKIVASQTDNFTNADTLATIIDTPIDYWQELALNNKKAYKYYRIMNKPSYPHLHMAEIEFITSKTYGYSNTISATKLPILPYTINNFDDGKVRIMDEPLDKCRWKAEYDQDIYTAPDRWADVTLRLQKPQVVTHIRFIPKTANNTIVINNKYQLMMWNGKIWEEVQTQLAKYNYLPIENMKIGKLYWLRNLTEGKEELPFYINNQGNQVFLHSDLLKIIKGG